MAWPVRVALMTEINGLHDRYGGGAMDTHAPHTVYADWLEHLNATHRRTTNLLRLQFNFRRFWVNSSDPSSSLYLQLVRGTAAAVHSRQGWLHRAEVPVY